VHRVVFSTFPKTGMIQPNLATDDDGLIDVPQELTGVEEYLILQ